MLIIPYLLFLVHLSGFFCILRVTADGFVTLCLRSFVCYTYAMDEMFQRTVSLIGEEALDRLRSSRVCIIGLGGVGSFAAEACVRSGVGSLLLIDHDTVSASNLNRQLCALRSTVDLKKTAVLRERYLDISPECRTDALDTFITSDNVGTLGLEGCDYVIDAIDNITAKVAVASFLDETGVPHISVMGTGNKLRPERLRVSDIYSTNICPMARAVRKLCREKGIVSLRTVWSDETPVVRPGTPASMTFVPASAGLLAAREAVLCLTGMQIG